MRMTKYTYKMQPNELRREKMQTRWWEAYRIGCIHDTRPTDECPGLDDKRDFFSEHVPHCGAASDMHIHTNNLLSWMHLVVEAVNMHIKKRLDNRDSLIRTLQVYQICSIMRRPYVPSIFSEIYSIASVIPTLISDRISWSTTSWLYN